MRPEATGDLLGALATAAAAMREAGTAPKTVSVKIETKGAAEAADHLGDLPAVAVMVMAAATGIPMGHDSHNVGDRHATTPTQVRPGGRGRDEVKAPNLPRNAAEHRPWMGSVVDAVSVCAKNPDDAFGVDHPRRA